MIKAAEDVNDVCINKLLTNCLEFSTLTAQSVEVERQMMHGR